MSANGSISTSITPMKLSSSTSSPDVLVLFDSGAVLFEPAITVLLESDIGVGSTGDGWTTLVPFVETPVVSSAGRDDTLTSTATNTIREYFIVHFDLIHFNCLLSYRNTSYLYKKKYYYDARAESVIKFRLWIFRCFNGTIELQFNCVLQNGLILYTQSLARCVFVYKIQLRTQYTRI